MKNVSVVEADPENLTITDMLGKKNISDIEIAEYDEQTEQITLKKDSFDAVLDSISESANSGDNGIVLVDVGSGTYKDALSYMRSLGIERTIQEEGGEFWIGSVVSMKDNVASSVQSVEDLCSTFHNVLVIDNHYNGEAKRDFEITETADPVGVIKYPRLSAQELNASDTAMSTSGITSILEASTNKDIPFSKRSWLKKLNELLFGDEGVFTGSEVIKRIAAIGRGDNVESIVDFHKKMKPAESDSGEG